MQVGVDYARTLALQDGKCAICWGPPDLRRRLAIDHDHVNGAIRGLLCGRCNIGLGLAGDSPTLLRAMAEYLERGGSGKPIIKSLGGDQPNAGSQQGFLVENGASLRSKMILALTSGSMSPVDLASKVGEKLKRVNEKVKRCPKMFTRSQGKVKLTTLRTIVYEYAAQPESILAAAFPVADEKTTAATSL